MAAARNCKTHTQTSVIAYPTAPPQLQTTCDAPGVIFLPPNDMLARYMRRPCVRMLCLPVTSRSSIQTTEVSYIVL